MRKKEYRAMIPIDAQPLETIFSTHRNQDKARAFLQHLFFQRMRMKSNRKYAPGLDRDNGWCPVSSKKMQKLMRDYKPIIRKLIDHGVIEVRLNEEGNEGYLADKYTKLYRPKFGPGITSAEQQRYRVEMITHRDVVAAIHRVYVERGYEPKKEVFLESTPWFSKNLEFMEGLYIDLSDEKLYELYPEKYHYLMGVKNKFNDAIGRHISRDDYSGRINSWVTSLSKKLVPYLRHRDGSEVESWDMSCSQPFTLSSIFRYPRLLDLIPEFRPIERKIKAGQHHTQIKTFHLDCRIDNLYTKLEHRTGFSRNDVKIQVFHHVMYCPVADCLEGEAKEERMRFRNGFRSEYGRVYDKIFDLKRTRKSTLPFIPQGGWAMSNTVNMICARLEVAIAIELIAKTCTVLGIHIGTRHDEFIIRSEDRESFKEVYYGVFKQLGIEPAKIKSKTPEAHDIIKQEEK